MSALPPRPDHGRPTPFALAAPRDWDDTAEELHVVEEELRVQSEALAAADDALKAERHRYHKLFNLAPDAYLETDAEGVIREANRAAAGLLNAPGLRLAGKPLRVFIEPDRRLAFDSLLARLRAGERLAGVEELIAPRGRTPLPASLTAEADYDDRGRPTSIRWLLHDLTELTEARARTARAEQLAAVGQTVAVLAHESRNALQRSQACLRLLALEVEDRSAALGYVDRIQAAHDTLARLFEDVRALAPSLRLARKPCDLAVAWRRAWDQLEPLRHGRDALLTERVAGDAPTCSADEFRLEQVFRNLFDNALAAAPDPVRVTVEVGATTDAGGRPALQVAVGDNGPGLTAEQTARLFEPFYTTKPGGMGLGMAVIRRIVEAHGGAVWVEPAPGGGTRVTFTLPREEP